MRVAVDLLLSERTDGMSERYSDEQAKAILARAIELDSRTPTATADDLRAIASDLGISPTSLEAALKEHEHAGTARQLLVASRAGTAIASAGLPLGIAAGALLGAGNWLAALGVMTVGLVASGSLVILEGPTATLRSFHLKNSALWGSMALGGLLSVAMLGASDTRVPALITAGWCLRGWFASSILGSAAVIAARRARHHGSDPDRDPAENAGLPRTGRWQRLTSGLLDWTGRSLRRGTDLAASRLHALLSA